MGGITYADGRFYSNRELAQRRWRQMIYRCTRPDHHAYANYGGRGVKVCPEWMDFETYYTDVGDPPPGMSLDRIDNDGDYAPSNVRWATPKEQHTNRRYDPNRLKTHCKAGHPYEGANLYRSPDGKRHCRTCRTQWEQDRRRAQARRKSQEKEGATR